MATINSIPASTVLLSEFNTIGPDRSRASDGTIGDTAHAHSSSDHNPDESGATPFEDSDDLNEVHARDVTDAGPWLPGWSMERAVQTILARCRSGQEVRLQNIIYNRRVWSRSSGWVQRVYTGSNPHDHHAHFSFRYGSGASTSNPENITSGYGLVAALRAEQEKASEREMDKGDMIEVLNSDAGQEAIGKAAFKGVLNGKLGRSEETVGMDLQSDETAPVLAKVEALEAKVDEIIAMLVERAA